MNALFSFAREQSSKEPASSCSSEKLSDGDTHPSQSTNPFDDLIDEEDHDKSQDTDVSQSDIHEDGMNPFGEDPLINELERHWQELSDLIDSSLTDPFALQEFKDHLKVIAELLNKELQGTASTGRTSECLEYFLSQNVLEKAYLFSTRQRLYCSEVRLTLLTFSTSLLLCSGPPLFIHQQVLRPLTRLLRACEMAQDQWLDSNLVALLQQICILIQENESLLELFFTVGSGKVPSKFLVFTLLVRYMHNLSEPGMRARDAMLLCLSIAGRSPHSSLCDFIITDTDFCQVLATGLSATYSQLPQVVCLVIDEWESPLASFEQSIPEMKKFMQALSYCNSVLQMAPLLVSQACVRLVKKGFLNQVLGPALLQTSIDEAATSTGYLTVFLLNISNVQLMRTFLQFVLTVQYDGHFVLNTLIQNIASEFQQLSSITLELFNVLLDLNCEDILLELILKYLLSGGHVMASQIPTISSRDLYGVASRKLLSLIPSCCIKSEKILIDAVFNSPHSSRSSTPPLQNSPTKIDSSNTTPTIVKQNHVRRDSTSSTCSTTSLTGQTGLQQNHTQPVATSDTSLTRTPLIRQPSQLTELINSSIMFSVLTPEAAYHTYLEESRAAIFYCARACQCWSTQYDCCIDSNRKVNQEHKMADDTILENGSVMPVNEPDHSPHFDLTIPVVRYTPSPSHNDTEAGSVGECSPNISPNLSPRNNRKSFRKQLTASSRFNDSTGLFLKILFERLSQLLQNPPIINILLFKTITRLCQYPQPLLKSLLLNHQLVLKSGVPNLFNVLQDLKQMIERIDREREGFEVRVARARKTMIYKAAIRNGQVDNTIAKQITILMNEGESRCDSRLSDQTEQGAEDTPPLPRRRARTEGSRGLEKLRKRKKIKVSINMVYSVILLAEFLKELSALSLEHSIINPELLQIIEEINR